jgi:hypothetical protein
MTSFDPFRFGGVPMVNVVRLRSDSIVPMSQRDGFGIACIVVRQQSDTRKP